MSCNFFLQAPEGSFHPTVNTTVPDYMSQHAAFAKRIAAKKLELLKRSQRRPPRPFLLQTDLAHAPMLQRLRCKYDVLQSPFSDVSLLYFLDAILEFRSFHVHQVRIASAFCFR